MEPTSDTNLLLWLGIGFCITQSAMFSGLNLAFFSVPRLRLEIEAGNKNKAAIKVLKLREDSNFLLATILWGNVGINVFSPGGLGSAQNFEKVNFSNAVLDALENKVDYMSYYNRNFDNDEMACL